MGRILRAICELCLIKLFLFCEQSQFYSFIHSIFTFRSHLSAKEGRKKRGAEICAPTYLIYHDGLFPVKRKLASVMDFCVLHEENTGILWIIPCCNPFAPVLFYRYRKGVKDTHRFCIPISLSYYNLLKKYSNFVLPKSKAEVQTAEREVNQGC